MHLDQLVEAYIKQYLERTKTGKFIAAWTDVDDEILAMNKNPKQLAEFLNIVLLQAPNEHFIGYVAAGPLEDLLTSKNMLEVLDQIEKYAITNTNFREALAGVWGLEGEVLERLRRFLPKNHPQSIGK